MTGNASLPSMPTSNIREERSAIFLSIVGKELRFNGALIWDLETEGSIFTVSEMANGGQKQIIRAIFKRGYHSLPTISKMLKG